MQSDVVIIGAGAAGLMCAIEAGKRGRRVVVIEHARKPAEKIRISGGGRCNFTNIYASPDHYLSANPRYCVSALARYMPRHFISLVERHGIGYHEKTLGQLFCDQSSQQIIDMLLAECRQANVMILLNSKVGEINKPDVRFRVRAASEEYSCESLVIATGGLSIPKMGATGFGYEIARQFGLTIVPPRAGLVPFALSETQLAMWAPLAGISVRAEAACGKQRFREGLLFTHRGLSGPVMLQISSYWRPKEELRVNVAPDQDVSALLKREKAAHSKQELDLWLGALVPKRLAQRITELQLGSRESLRLMEISNKELGKVAAAVNDWRIVPHGTEGYRTAEVTLGGVDTNELSSQSMAARKIENLYFIGEVVDVTGQLGGYNFQWAWASGYVAGQYV